MHRSSRRRRRRRLATLEVQCPRCLYVAAHLRGGQLRFAFRWMLVLVVAAVFIADMVTQTHRSIENLSQATPVLAILGLGSLFLPAPALHCTRCEQQKAKKKGDDAGAAA